MKQKQCSSVSAELLTEEKQKLWTGMGLSRN